MRCPVSRFPFFDPMLAHFDLVIWINADQGGCPMVRLKGEGWWPITERFLSPMLSTAPALGRCFLCCKHLHNVR
jgi:hypothetical protein